MAVELWTAPPGEGQGSPRALGPDALESLVIHARCVNTCMGAQEGWWWTRARVGLEESLVEAPSRE